MNRNELDDNRPLTVAEVASYLRYSERAVRQMAQRGELPGRKFGHEWRFDRSSMLEICRVKLKPTRPRRKR